MADSNSLKVMAIFEAGARLRCNAETIGLAAHIYHRYFRIKHQMNQYDLFAFAAACIKLAYWFYELPINTGDLALVSTSIVHGPQYYLDPESKNKLEQSIDFVAKIITTNLDYQIDYKDTRMMTPGDLLRSKNQQQIGEVIVLDKDSSDDDDDDDDDEKEEDRLLTKCSRNQISSHRYLVHYLKSIKLLVDKANESRFKKLSNIAWTFLTDFYWSPCVTQHYPNHIACACLTMAIETFRKDLESSKNHDKAQLWTLLNKKWNLILCDDLNMEHLERIIGVIVTQYAEYERVLQHELSTYVIDPKRSENANNMMHI